MRMLLLFLPFLEPSSPPQFNRIASCFVVPFSPAYHPVQLSFGHTFVSFLLQPLAVIRTLAPFCASSSVKPLQGLGVVPNAFLMEFLMIGDAFLLI